MIVLSYMKTRKPMFLVFRVLFASMLIVLFCLNAYAYDGNDLFQEEDYIFSNRTSTVVYTCLNNQVIAYQNTLELSEEAINYLSNIATNYQYIDEELSPTSKFNCHSYAWYMQNTTNNIWLDAPGAFLTDCMYEVANPNQWQVNDIVYYDNSYYDNGGLYDHSAIISSSQGTYTTTILDSKWGMGGLYSHSLINCPYYLSETNIHVYRYCSSHNYGSATFKNILLHTYTCTLCGYELFESHSINPMTGRCYQCGCIGMIVEPYSFEDDPIIT